MRSPQCVKKSQGRNVLADGAGGEFTLAKQVRLVFADMLLAQLIRAAMEVFGEFSHSAEVGLRSTLRVITTLEFLQHHFSLLGHRDLLVTQRYRVLCPTADPSYVRVASAASAA